MSRRSRATEVVVNVKNDRRDRQFSRRDAVDDTWAAQDPLKNFVRDLTELLYH